MNALELASARQAAWSVTANSLKSTVDNARWLTFGLSLAGAILATVASQLPEGESRKFVAIIGAAILAIATFVNLRFCSSERSGAWVKARSAAEALKREIFKCAAGAAPYGDPTTADAILKLENAKVEDGVSNLTGELIDSKKAGTAPTSPLTQEEYVSWRVRGQIDAYYTPKAARFRRIASRLRTTEMIFALLATVITAVVGVLKKYPVNNIPFDLAALTSIFTTIGASVLANIEASRYAFLVTSYRATARRLEQAMLDLNGPPPTRAADWSAFVEKVESIIAAENNSWVAKWSGAGK